MYHHDCLFRFLPESFRWLIIHQRFSELKLQVDKIVRFNNIQHPSIKFPNSEVFVKENTIKQKKLTMFNIFTYAEIRKRLLAVFFTW